MRDAVRPAADPAVAAYPVDDELVLYDPRRGQGFVLNRTAARIWSLCDGSRTVRAVAAELASAYALEDEQALSDVSACLNELSRACLLRA
ncbi:MAG: HPr-rel-A system PqqD family peptide chaperone [Chloroflexi bacterium]|nr:HPr-rel-A system PqqD family peptide chaperone [Chloroflexota bacterium]MBV9546915.1 HPr-rel-A system PqqD family peptide chaperone [Chloroflexota bacterium]